MRRLFWSALALTLVILVIGVLPASAQDLPRGQIVDDVRCAADPTQGFALYLPSTYAPGRTWSLLMGFHPCRARAGHRRAAPCQELLLTRSGKQTDARVRMAR